MSLSGLQPNALSIRQLKKVYDNGFEALKGIDLEVQQGDFFALLGPNGAGKSTTIGVVSALVTPTAGEVRVFGHSMRDDWVRAKREIGLVPQEFNFNMFEPIENILVNVAGFYGIGRREARLRAGECLEQLDLTDKRRGPGRELSGGMKRRVMIARALMHRPRLLILDEPTAGVDIEIRRSMWRFLEEINGNGTTIILTTHYLEEAEALCRNMAIIDHGEIIEEGGVQQLLKQAAMQTLVLDTGEAPESETVEQLPFASRLRNDGLLEVDLPGGKSINELFGALSQLDLNVISMRNKSNRLEAFFMQRVEREHRSAL